MEVALLLDENISPTLCDRFWSVGVDALHVNFRGLDETPDHVIWQFAQDEARTLVTINYGHFRTLATSGREHFGLITIPSGGSRDIQFKRISYAIAYAQSANSTGLTPFYNRTIAVGFDGGVTIDTVIVDEAENDP